MRRIFMILLAALLVGPIKAGELLEYYVNEVDDHFLLHLDMRVDASHKEIRSTLMDFSKMPEVNDTVIESRLIERSDNKHKIFFVSKGCIWVFCQTIEQVAMVSEPGPGYIMSSIIAEESDLRYGKSLWRLIDEGSKTRVIYSADYVPDFWVPPVIGSSIAKQKMLNEGRKTINGLERLIKSKKLADEQDASDLNRAN
ncbi:hypothetical protein [Thiohalophilus sp.]|uniref:hypothetical protein n=1 Tax=Thiohalophilus sp. TaxID=3028392 RepID=UPI002ACEBBA9|nr:hypothetical protein [Thiohalophilus sp.]MDZ7805350.1 hypothetical protein [Thiohalophilus sp.]